MRVRVVRCAVLCAGPVVCSVWVCFGRWRLVSGVGCLRLARWCTWSTMHIPLRSHLGPQHEDAGTPVLAQLAAFSEAPGC